MGDLIASVYANVRDLGEMESLAMQGKGGVAEAASGNRRTRIDSVCNWSG